MKLNQIFLLCLRVGGIFLLVISWALQGNTQPNFGPPPPRNSGQENLPQSSFSPPPAPSEGRPPMPGTAVLQGTPPIPVGAPSVPSLTPIPVSAPDSPSNMPGETAEPVIKTKVLETISIQPVKYTSEKLPDPFLSPFEREVFSKNKPEIKTEELEISPEELEGFQVTGIVWGAKLPQAIINETVVEIGQVVNGAVILDITKKGVYVLYEEKKYLLKTPR